mgnify:CR=1 FL=1
MKVLVIGSRGQVGRELMDSVPSGVDCIGLDLPELDVADRSAVEDAVHEMQPSLVVNVAAYTAVDLAEDHPAAAYAANEIGRAHV